MIPNWLRSELRPRLILYAVVMFTVVGISAWRRSPGPPPGPPPPAKPVLLRHEVQTALFGANSLAVEVRNDGADGWVRVLYTTSHKVTEVRREPDAVEWLKNTFTSEGSPGFTVNDRWVPTGAWDAYAWIKAGETRWITFEMPRHSSFDYQGDPQVSAITSVPGNANIR